MNYTANSPPICVLPYLQESRSFLSSVVPSPPSVSQSLWTAQQSLSENRAGHPQNRAGLSLCPAELFWNLQGTSQCLLEPFQNLADAKERGHFQITIVVS